MNTNAVRSREVDLDPPPRRWRTNADGVLLARATADRAGARRLLPEAWGAMTLDQKRRRLRDLLIVFGSEVCGLSERELAEVTGLARSRVHSIREQFKGQGGD